MAQLQVGLGADDYEFMPSLFMLADPGDVTTTSSTEFIFENEGGDTVTVTGTGFVYASGRPTGGTITSVVVTNGADTLLTINQFSSEALKPFADAIFDGDRFGAMVLLLDGADQLLGSIEGDDIGGYSPGDDIVNGDQGDDFIKGDEGNDQIDGGDGFDTLAYIESYYDKTAKKGITVDTGKGTVKDSWGNKDTFTSIEAVWGSKHDDKMKGDSGFNEFAGLRGKDKIDGKAGLDLVDYSHDSQWPGKGNKGIKTDLDKGTIRDGYGDTDSVKNIEIVRGTANKDVFKGGNKDDQFQGLDGQDSYKGGKGFDIVDFSANNFNNGATGVTVDLGAKRVTNDGFGNSEKLSKIEGMIGTALNDSLTGDGKGNFLSGGDGNDQLAGGDAADAFFFEFTADNATNHDVIADFDASEGDIIALLASAFPAVTSPVDGPLSASEFEAVAGGAATSAATRIVYDTTNGDLFYDPDGNATSGDEVLIAELTGAPALTAAAFEIWS